MAVGIGVVLPARYQDARLIAAGGVADVYRAVDGLLDRRVAVKVLAERFAADERVRKRFTREALAAAPVSSEPFVATIYDVGEMEGRPFVVMQYFPGGSLRDVLRRQGAQPATRALAWLEQAAHALDLAHDRGLVHRGLKPENLLLDEQERVHVADFGSQSALALAEPPRTLENSRYLAPEQMQGVDGDADADEYALAVVAFELLTGSGPSDASHQPTAPSVWAHQAAIPRAAEAVFARALARAPAERFESCGAFVAALRGAVGGPGDPTALSPAAMSPDAARLPKRRQQLLSLIGLLALVAGGIAAAVAATDHGGGQAATVAVPVTVTAPGTTLRETVTVKAPEPPAAPAVAPAPTTSPSTTSTPATTTIESAPVTTVAVRATVPVTDAATLALSGFQRLRSGDAGGALPLLRQAALRLDGTRTLEEAYNDYNLAAALTATAGCSAEVLQLLDRSESIQGPRAEISRLRQRCR
jgi:eukaryotic-like serine/threonine-protein kinase